MSPSLSALRAMRDRLRLALRRGVVGVLDVGSAKTTCMILRVDPARLARAEATGAAHAVFGAMRVIGVGITRSHGVRLGEIVDMDEACRGIRNALEMAEKMAGERVDQVISAISGARPQSMAARGEAWVEGLEVAPRDVARAIHAADWPPLEEGREFLHAQPVNFGLDGTNDLTDPRGMTGNRLACDLHLVSVAANPLRDLAHCVRRCDLELAGVVAAPYAAGLSSLVEDEQKLGAACIDMGAGATGISVFLRGQLIHLDSVRIGGEHITLDIAHALTMSTAAAERIKSFHGGAVATGLDDRDMIEAPPVGEAHGGPVAPGERRNISRAALIGVIRPRLEEILETARDRLRAAGFEHLPGRRIVLTGGASQLPGLEDASQRILGRRARLGRPLHVPGLPQNATGPAFASAAGLCIHAARPRDEAWDFEVPMAMSGLGRIDRALRWVQETW
jgi:cell division protein FtsA